MHIDQFDFQLPEDLIAQAPATPRDASRLLVLPAAGDPVHRKFTDLPGLLRPGDLLVFNDTRVIPARLLGRKESGGQVELLLCEPLAGGLGHGAGMSQHGVAGMARAGKTYREILAHYYPGTDVVKMY